MRYRHITALLVLGVLLGLAGPVHAQRPPVKESRGRLRGHEEDPVPRCNARMDHPHILYAAAWGSVYSCVPVLHEPPPGPNCGRVLGVIAMAGALT